MEKARCLLLLPRPVFPLVCGYALKNCNLIRILAERYQLRVVIIAEKDISEEEKTFYNTVGAEFSVYLLSRLRSCFHVLFGLFSRKPLQVCYYYDRKLQKELRAAMDESEVLIAALVRTREYLKIAEGQTGKTLVFDMADSIALNYLRSKDRTRSWFWKVIYTIEGRRLLKYERDYIRRSSVTYLFNQEEQNYWRKYGSVKWLPHGVNDKLFAYKRYETAFSRTVVFIGKMDYQPNVDAALWYLENVHVRLEDTPFMIVGAYPAERLRLCAEKYKNVVITGFVEDPYLYVASALAVVAPMQTGGGIQNKVLEGMALGKVNIVSSLAAKPIVGARDGEHLLVADVPDQYVEYLMNMATGVCTYEQIGINARRLIQEKYTWQAYGESYLEGIAMSRSRGENIGMGMDV